MEQKLSTPLQHTWLAKLLGYDYKIIYKKGVENVAADALSRIPGTDLLTMTLSSILSELLEKIKNNWQTDPTCVQLIQHLDQGKELLRFTWKEGLLRRKGRMVVGADEGLRNEILVLFHASALGGHSGVTATLQRINSLIYWKGLKKHVRGFVRCCKQCQKHKYDRPATPGLLQPLSTPEGIFTDITMDFITGLPNSKGKEVIFVVVDRLSKYSHFMALSHP